MSSAAPPPVAPGDAPPGAASAPDAPARGCMKWGLVGCAALSLVAIAGMVLFLRKAPQLMETLLGATESQVLAALEPDVPAEEREAFRRAFAGFVETAKAGEAKPAAIQELQEGIVGALQDGRVSGEELRGLTERLRSVPKP